MYYSAAVVGLNTSAFIEAAVVGKPVLTVLLPEISTAQPGRHAALPLPARGQRRAAARVAHRSTSTCRMLAASLAGPGGGDAKAERFVEGFVRPFGRDEPATPRFVEAVETAAALPAPRAGAARPGGDAGACGVVSRWRPCCRCSLRTQPWRKRTRNRLAKAIERRKLAAAALGQAGRDRPVRRLGQAAEARRAAARRR